MGNRRGKGKSNITFFPDRMRYVIKLRNYNNSKLIRDLNSKYPDNAINLRTFLRNMQDGNMDPVVIDLISRLLDVNPDYLTGWNNYDNAHRAEILTRYLVPGIMADIKINEDQDGTIIEPYKMHSMEFNSFRLFNLWNEYFRAYVDHLFSGMKLSQYAPELSKDEFITKFCDDLERKTDRSISESLSEFHRSILESEKIKAIETGSAKNEDI